MTIVNPIFIPCGADQSKVLHQKTINKSLFWPVLQAIPLTFRWPPKSKKKCSVIFTSQNAAEVFTREYSLQKNHNIEAIGTVGKVTAKLVQSKMGSFLKNNKNISLISPKEEGLFHLLNESSFSPNTTVYIMTASNGRTNEVISKINQIKLPFSCEVIPVYRLEPFESSFLLNFFTQNPNAFQSKIVFTCHSGKILKTAVEQLTRFFSVEDVSQLPPNIYFSVEKQSTKNEASSLGLLDRIYT